MSQTNHETRKRIFDCAFALIKEKGYEQVTVKEISRAAGISKNTFYYYFTSKEDILIEFYRAVDASTAAKLSRVLNADSYLEQLWLLSETFLNFISISGPQLTRQFIASGFVRNIGTESSLSNGSDVYHSTITLIEKAQRSGQIRNHCSAEELARASFHLLVGIVTRWCADANAYDVKAEVLRMYAILYDIPEESRTILQKIAETKA